MSDLGPPPSELRAMLAAERDVSAADRVAIRSQLEASVGAPRGGGGFAAGKLVAVGGALLLVAVGLWWQLGRSPSASAPVVAPAPIESATADEPSRIAQPEQAPVAETSAEPPARKQQPAPSQAELLAKAWRSLASGDAAAALRIVDEDLRLHPAGPLTEERDAIRIKALAAAGRMDEARELARTFLAQFPTSVHRKAARQLVGEGP